MFKNKWLLAAIAIVIILAGLWYAGVLQNIVPGGTDESASVANSMKVTTVATAIQKTVADISTALGNKDSKAIANLGTEFAATVDSVSVIAPQFQKSINAAINKGKNVGSASAAYTDLAAKLSLLESSTLTLQNAQAEVTNLNAVYADISAMRTNLQQVKVQ